MTEPKPTPWPADEIVRRPVAKLVPYARNARTHSKEQVRQIAASIREWGWTNPVLIDEDDGVIAGHGRLLAAEMLGIVMVPCVVARGWTRQQRQAYVLADNQLALNAGWDRDMLRVELGELRDGGFDLGLVGFDPLELRSMLDEAVDLTQVSEEHVERPDAPASRAGDLWIMGRHRLLCGDSTSSADVQRLLAGRVPFLMVTDPPYGVDYDPGWRNRAGVSQTARTGKVQNDDRADWTEAWRLFPGDVAYVWHASRHAAVVSDSLRAAGFEVRSQIVWRKQRFALSRVNYHWQHEPCLYCVRDSAGDLTADQEQQVLAEVREMLRGGYDDDHVPCWYSIRRSRSARWIGDRKQSTIWDVDVTDDGEKNRHGTQKPLEVMGRPIRNHDAPEVYEPFCGSGTTLVACEILGRTCLAMEIDPGYVDVIVRRWQNRTGQQAVLDSDGSTFDAIVSRRVETRAEPVTGDGAGSVGVVPTDG